MVLKRIGFRPVAPIWLERRSPKPHVVGSSPSWPAVMVLLASGSEREGESLSALPIEGATLAPVMNRRSPKPHVVGSESRMPAVMVLLASGMPRIGL